MGTCSLLPVMKSWVLNWHNITYRTTAWMKLLLLSIGTTFKKRYNELHHSVCLLVSPSVSVRFRSTNLYAYMVETTTWLYWRFGYTGKFWWGFPKMGGYMMWHLAKILSVCFSVYFVFYCICSTCIFVLFATSVVNKVEYRVVMPGMWIMWLCGGYANMLIILVWFCAPKTASERKGARVEFKVLYKMFSVNLRNNTN